MKIQRNSEVPFIIIGIYFKNYNFTRSKNNSFLREENMAKFSEILKYFHYE